MSIYHRMTLLALSITVAACGETARLPFSAGIGPDPALPAPNKTLIPTVEIAPAKGWPEGGRPSAAEGLAVTRFADGLEHPRWLHVLPNGDVLVAESNAPPKPADERSIKGWIQKQVMKRAGAGVPSANRITLLRDADGDGVAEVREPFLEGLNSPFGMALVGADLYVANTDALVRYPYVPGQVRIAAPGVEVVGLPGGSINHHWTKNVVASADGSRLYVTTGSNSNVAERGIEAEGCGPPAGLGTAPSGPAETCRAAIWEVDPRTGAWRIFASGLRNPNGMAWEPRTGALWTVVNERDEIGSDLVPDYLTAVRDGGFYGWPYSYFGRHVDARVQPPRPDLVARAIKPDFALGTHVAPLGLAWSGGAALPARFAQGMFVGQHGSWNRRPMSGYDVVFVPFRDGRPTGEPPLPVLAGFVDADGHALGRPVGVAIDRRGALLVADDVGNAIWRVSAAGPAQGAGR